METIRISDVTMKQPEEKLSLSFRDKIELSKLLDELGVSVIELEPLKDTKSDMLRIKSIASSVKNSIVAVPVTFEDGNAAAAFQALQGARHPRLQIHSGVSYVQMEYLHHKKADAMLEAIGKTVKGCRALCSDVEWIADDATRSEREFLVRAIHTACENGATQVTFADDAGTMLPQEFADFIKDIRQEVPQEVAVGISCRDTLSMADACSMAALSYGVQEIKTAAYPVTVASLSNISRILQARGDSFSACCSVRVNQLSRVMQQISRMCGGSMSQNAGGEGGAQEAEGDLMLTIHDSMEAIGKATQRLGYDLTPQDLKKVYDAFCTIAAHKEQVSIRELDVIIASSAMHVPSAYCLEAYSVQAGNTVSATAQIRLRRNGESHTGLAMGDGPIDAAFMAIESITGRHYDLDDFRIQAVTKGREAMGEAMIKLLYRSRIYSGRGISTDIVGSSIQAYLSALNKIVYEEEE